MGYQMNIKVFLHAPSHLFLLILLGILGTVAVGWSALTILFLSIVEILILSLNKLYRYKNGEWMIVPKYRICNIGIAALTIAICLFFIFGAK